MLGLLFALGACDLKCDLCVMSTDEVGDGVTQGFTDAEIRSAISEVCAALPDPYSTYCTEYESHITSIIADVRSGKASQSICSEIGFCVDGMPINAYTNLIRSAVKKQVRKISSEKLSSDKTCSIFKGDAGVLCKEASLIAKVSMKQLSKTYKLGEESVCGTCQKIIASIKEMLNDHASEEAIVSAAVQTCEEMPTSYAAICRQAISTYIPLILQLLEEGIEALNICQNFGLCGARAASRVPKLENRKGVACDTCQFLYRWLEQQLETVTVSELWRLVSVECPKVEYIKYICGMITEENVQTLVSMIIGQVSAQTACSVLSIC